jgi:hypothetical protein
LNYLGKWGIFLKNLDEMDRGEEFFCSGKVENREDST